jgi:hypothetical protein
MESTLDRIIGVKPPEGMLRASKKRLDEMFKKRFSAEVAAREQLEKVTKAFYQPYHEQAKMDKEVQRSIKALSKLAGRRQKLVVPETAPVKRVVSLGPLGMTLPPPYTWTWTWSATNGSPRTPAVTADKNSGRMSFFLDGGDGGSASAAVALGIYLRPPIQDLGILQVKASPAFSYIWWTFNTFASSHSDGWIGIYVGEYTLNGT